MKSERRHELQHNELADWLAKMGEAIRPHQNAILAGLVTVLIVVLGYTYWSRTSAARTTEAWDQVSAAIEGGKIDELAQVAEDYPNSYVGHMAAVVLADVRLAEGCNGLFTDNANARQDLTKAIHLYTIVRDRSRTPSLLERATFGLARARESKGELESAEKLYEEITSTWPEGTYTVAASERLEDLKRPATKKLYDDFRGFDPKPSFSSGSADRPRFELEDLSEDALEDMPANISDLKFDDQDEGQPTETDEDTGGQPDERQ